MQMNKYFLTGSPVAKQLYGLLPKFAVSMVACLLLTVYALPVSYMFVTAFKDEGMMSDPKSPILWPAEPATFAYDGQVYPVYQVPIGNDTQQWALVEKGREQSTFLDPANPEAGLNTWVGRWRTLEPVWEFSPVFNNIPDVWVSARFPILLKNTIMAAVIGVTGTLFSSIAVAYGFARFRMPGQDILFALLIGSLLLPRELLQVPLYSLFNRIGWMGTWLPLLVPQFFANALYVFLLRQHFRTLSKDLDEAAYIDGAGPFRILISIILPQSVPVIATVVLLQFFYIWKDYYLPLLYLAGNRDLLPVSLGVSAYGQLFFANLPYVQAASLLSLFIPAVVFLFTQGYIVKGAEAILGRRK
jgi:multiple sugar transport system permease protein